MGVVGRGGGVTGITSVTFLSCGLVIIWMSLWGLGTLLARSISLSPMLVSVK